MKITFFDTETTGLISNTVKALNKQPHISQFYSLTCDENGNELSDLSLWANPPVEISDEVFKVTKVSKEMLGDKPPFKDIALQIKDNLESADIVVAHNAMFDKQMVNFEMQRLRLAVNWPIVICTVEATEHLKGYRLKLGLLYELLFDEKLTGAHDAAIDVRALARCYFELKKINEI